MVQAAAMKARAASPDQTAVVMARRRQGAGFSVVVVMIATPP
jgi:hypothetical protein